MNLPTDAPWWAFAVVFALWAIDRVVLRKTESAGSIADQWADLSESLRQQVRDHAEDIEKLKVSLRKVERENKALRKHNFALTQQVVGLGEQPIPFEDFYSDPD